MWFRVKIEVLWDYLSTHGLSASGDFSVQFGYFCPTSTGISRGWFTIFMTTQELCCAKNDRQTLLKCECISCTPVMLTELIRKLISLAGNSGILNKTCVSDITEAQHDSGRQSVPTAGPKE